MRKIDLQFPLLLHFSGPFFVVVVVVVVCLFCVCVCFFLIKAMMGSKDELRNVQERVNWKDQNCSYQAGYSRGLIAVLLRGLGPHRPA